MGIQPSEIPKITLPQLIAIRSDGKTKQKKVLSRKEAFKLAREGK